MEYFKKNGVPRGTPRMVVLFWFRDVSRETPKVACSGQGSLVMRGGVKAIPESIKPDIDPPFSA